MDEQIKNTPGRGVGIISAAFWLRDLALSVLFAVILIVFIYQPVKVEGTSMMPSLTDQERIFINKFTYRFGIGNIERGDMVVFWFPLDKTKSYIKRVIGLPGDKIEIDSGVVLVNGQRLSEDYVPDDYRDRNSYPEQEVPQNHYYVLGDHRSSSNDSRAWGTVERSYIYGKAVFVYWPLEKMGRVEVTGSGATLKRELGLRDTTLFAIACIIGTRWIPAAARAGAGSVTLWLLAAIFFVVPLAVAVATLTVKYPGTGGMYLGRAAISAPGTGSCVSGSTGSASRSGSPAPPCST